MVSYNFSCLSTEKDMFNPNFNQVHCTQYVFSPLFAMLVDVMMNVVLIIVWVFLDFMLHADRLVMPSSVRRYRMS